MGVGNINEPNIVYAKKNPHKKGYINKYVLSKFDSIQDIELFFEKSDQGEWPRSFMSEDYHPVNWDNYVINATARNLPEILQRDPNEDVLLYISKDDCEHCKQFDPIYERAAKWLREKQPNVKIVLAKIDGGKNEVPDFNVKRFPEFLAYLSGGNKTTYMHVAFPRNYDDFISHLI